MAKTQAKQRRLGRGLSSLLNVESQEAKRAAPVRREVPPEPAAEPAPPPAGVEAGDAGTVAVGLIDPNPHQPRRAFAADELDELAASIRTNGVIQPVVLRPSEAGRYELIAGERRLRAAKLAGLDRIPAVVREVDPLAQAQQALVENVQRADLNPLERAASYRALLDQLGLTQADLAARLGEDRSVIANHLRLLNLGDPARDLVRDGRLPLGHAKVLAGVDDPERQAALARLAAEQELSVRNLERLTRHEPPKPKPTPDGRDSHLRRVGEQIGGALGARVEVHGRAGGRGKLVIHYHDLDGFDALLRRLDVRLDG